MDGHSLNSTAGALLGFLHEGPRTGWDLAATAERRIADYWTVTRSQVYRELAAMAEARLVKAGQRGQRERRPYSITVAGRAAFREWVNREPSPETIRFPLLLTIGFGRHLSRERLTAFVHRHHAGHVARLAHYETTKAALAASGELDPHVSATLDFGLVYERAVLAWFDELSPDIRGSTSWREVVEAEEA